MDANTISAFRVDDTDFARKRKLPFWRVAVLILKDWKTSLHIRVNKFFDDLDLLENVSTENAFYQPREKIRPEFFKVLNEMVVKFFYENYEKKGLVKRWKGRLLWAADGSYINIPYTTQTKEKYSAYSNQYDKKGMVQAPASFLYDVLNEINVNSDINDIKSEKSFILGNHIRHYCKDVIVIYDRLYADYSVIASHTKTGIDFVIRCPVSKTFTNIEKFINSDCIDKIASLEIPEKCRKFIKQNVLPEEITVRLVKVKLESGEIEVLMTSLLEEEYKIEDLKWLYNKLWGVKTYLDRLKNQLEVERFSSDKLIRLEHDFYSIVFLSTLESVLGKETEKEITEEGREEKFRYKYKINKPVSYSALIEYVVDLLLDLNKSPEEVVTNLNKLFRIEQTPVHPYRKFMRRELTECKKLRFHKYVKLIWA